MEGNEKNKATGVETVTGDILNGESDVSEHVVKDFLESDQGEKGAGDPAEAKKTGQDLEHEKDTTETEAKVDKYPGLTDKHGRPFDPEIHHFDEKTGYPRLNKSGKAKGKISIKKYVRRPGKKSKVAKPRKPKPAKEPETKAEEETQEKPKPSMPPEMAAKIAASITFKMGVALGGYEWEPQTDPKTGLNEAEFMTKAYQDYFEAKGVTEVSPGWILVIALTSYAMPRLTMPKTQTRLQRVSKGLARGFMLIKNKLSGKGNNGTRSDIRQDGERENDLSETPSSETES